MAEETTADSAAAETGLGDTGEEGTATGGTGDGDGDPGADESCEMLTTAMLALGSNPVQIPAGDSLAAGSCGADGPEAVFSFTPEQSGSLTLALTGFDAAIYAVEGGMCLPLGEFACVTTPMALSVPVQQGVVMYFMIDAATLVGGNGSLELTFTP